MHDTGHKQAEAGRMSVGRDVDAAMMAGVRADLCATPDVSASADGLSGILAEKFDLDAKRATLVAQWHGKAVEDEVRRQVSLLLLRVIGFFLLPGNLLLRAHALAHAARMADSNGLRSLRHSGELCGVSVEAIRKVAWKWVDMLGLPPLQGAKSEAAKKKYSTDKQTNHWRKRKC